MDGGGGAASFVAQQGGLAPRNDQPTYRKHFRLPPFANYAKDGPPTQILLDNSASECSVSSHLPSFSPATPNPKGNL